MNPVFLTWNRAKPAALLLLGMLVCAVARAGDTSTNSKPNGPEKALPGQGIMDKFEDNVFGSHQPLDIQPPGAGAPQVRRFLTAPKLDERAKQSLDAKKNWAFSGMNQLGSEPSPEELLGLPELGPDGLPKPKLSAMEQFYSNLGEKNQAGSSNQLSEALNMIWTVKQLSGTNTANPLVFAFPNGDQSLLKTIMTMPDAGRLDGDTSASDDSKATPESIAAAQSAAAADKEQKRRVGEFRQLLGLQSSSPADFSGSPGDFNRGPQSGFYNPAPAPAPAPVYAPAAPSSMSPVIGAFTPAPAGVFHPFDAGAMNSGNSVFGSPSASSRPVAAPPGPSVQTMPIDPFSQNFPKRKF